MLGVALLIAGIFAWLGQWQLGNAIATDLPDEGATEIVRPIEDVVAPGAYLSEPLVGQRVNAQGWWIEPDFLIVSSRFNDETEGFWVTGHLRMWDGEAAFGEQTPPTSLVVALAWAPTRELAEAAASDFAQQVNSLDIAQPANVTGRLISDEGPALPPPGASAWEMTRMSPAAHLAQWHDIEGLDVYRQFLVADLSTTGLSAPEGAVQIDSPAPQQGSSVNWLNIFYAVEWAVFAGFACYMWYRLTKDAWEKELEELEEAEAARAAAAAAGAASSGD